jgi:excisionase family DNA binding protein
MESRRKHRVQLLKPQEAAQRLSVSRPLILKWVDEGKLPCVILGVGPSGKRILRIKETDLEKFITEHENTVRERNAKRLRLATSAGADTKAGAA